MTKPPIKEHIVCSVEGCNNALDAQGFCTMHYKRMRKGADLTAPPRNKRYDSLCSVSDCEKSQKSKGFCNAHYLRSRKGSDMSLPVLERRETCSIDGCVQDHHAVGLCNKHYEAAWAAGQAGIGRTTICIVEGCEGRARGGMCRKHQRINLRYGDPHGSRELSTTYAAVHQRIRIARGKAEEYSCADCGQRARDWSYNHSGIDELVGPGTKNHIIMTYSADIRQYDPRCVKCHRSWDYGADGS